MTLNFSIFSVILDFMWVICICVEVLLFTSGLECENYSNACNFRDVYVLVTISHNAPYVPSSRRHQWKGQELFLHL